MIRNITLIAVVLCFSLAEVSAQTIFFSGVGRALLATESLVDKSDEQSELKASGGYTMMDLGIWAKPDEVLRANVILRQRNEFGGFFDNGTSLEFRQMQIEGLIAKKVKYEVGDIYLEHTPYTLWNSEAGFHTYESDLFGMRRDIAYYENFMIDNKWRMQGINTSAKVINFEKGLESIALRLYGGRTRATDFNTIPDRYFYGGRLDLVQSEKLSGSINLAGVTDIVGTVEDASVDYDNRVITAGLEYVLISSDKLDVTLKGEAGGSRFALSRESDTTQRSFTDYFFDVYAEALYKPLGLTVSAGYREVGYDFNSPMAQTRRLSAPTDLGLTFFPTLNDESTSRAFTQYDQLAQENSMYNQSISTTLMNYYIQYDMVEPYGKATPNRKGFTFSAEIEDPDKAYQARLEYNLLGEVVSEGDSLTQEKRSFSQLKGGVLVNIHQLLGFEKAIVVTAGTRLEKSSRGGTNYVELSSSQIDLGFEVEVYKKLNVLAGAKLFSVSGTELQTGRDELNQIVSFSPSSFDESHRAISLGIRYNFDKKAYFSAQSNLVRYEDVNSPLTQFDMTQWFFVFGLKF